MSDGCTIAAKRVGDGLFLLKNRDLVYEDFRDSALFDDTLFAVSGVNIGTGTKAGVSIGVNKWGLAACSSTVLIKQADAYDFLLEEILRKAKTVDKAHDMVSDSLRSGKRYQWCNFVVGTLEGVGAIEIGEGVCELERNPRSITRANHHMKLPTKDVVLKASKEEREAGGPLPTSEKRHQMATKMLESASSLRDMTAILSTHSDSRGFDSICRHRAARIRDNALMGETTYSYIIEMHRIGPKKLSFKMHVARGNPCSNPYKEIAIDFDLSSRDKERIIKDFP
ncbi:MAG: hypothetical protein C4K47_01885 [Candidatus Thorarchaeota archaeon]|nr:MAG: hypothetical protein C4K47_01885 [Candidatus Thorarchaeota archaeon]